MVNKTTGSKDIKRVQLNFSASAFADLEQLERRLNFNRQETFRHALWWLDWTSKQINKGGKILIKEPDGQTKELVLPFDCCHAAE